MMAEQAGLRKIGQTLAQEKMMFVQQDLAGLLVEL
jgi:hypothetical protein